MIGLPELALILIIVLLVFGGTRLAGIGKDLGKAFGGLRDALSSDGGHASSDTEFSVLLGRTLGEIKSGLEQVNSSVERELEDTVEPLRVFISSRQVELAHERERIAAAVRRVKITRPWRFEKAPATEASPTEVYLEAVRRSEIYLLVLGEDISEPVRQEYEEARDKNLSRLFFVKKCSRTPEAERFLSSELSNSTYREFSSLDELEEAISVSLWGLLADSVRKRANIFGLGIPDLGLLMVCAGELKIGDGVTIEELEEMVKVAERAARSESTQSDDDLPQATKVSSESLARTAEKLSGGRTFRAIRVEGRKGLCPHHYDWSIFRTEKYAKDYYTRKIDTALGSPRGHLMMKCNQCRLIFVSFKCPSCDEFLMSKVRLEVLSSYSCSYCGHDSKLLPSKSRDIAARLVQLFPPQDHLQR